MDEFDIFYEECKHDINGCIRLKFGTIEIHKREIVCRKRIRDIIVCSDCNNVISIDCRNKYFKDCPTYILHNITVTTIEPNCEKLIVSSNPGKQDHIVKTLRSDPNLISCLTSDDIELRTGNFEIEEIKNNETVFNNCFSFNQINGDFEPRKFRLNPINVNIKPAKNK